MASMTFAARAFRIQIADDRDAIIKVTACAICGSDLHIFDGMIPKMQSGDVLGHETMGEVVEVGRGVEKLRWATASWCPSRSHAENAFFAGRASFRAASARTRTEKSQRRCGGIRRQACLAIRMFSGATQADKRNTCASPTLTSGPSRFQTVFQTNRCSFCPTSFRPAIWPRNSATSKAAKRLRSGVAGRLASSRSEAHSSWARDE